MVELTAAVDGGGAPSERVFSCAAINARLETGIDNPLDAAIVAAATKLPAATDPEKIDEIPLRLRAQAPDDRHCRR